MPEEVSIAAAAQTIAGKYLTFLLLRESYGIDVLNVREIIRLPAITTMPHLPGHVKGVINLRGKIVPVMDLRLRFGFAAPQNTEHTCIVVVQTKLRGGQPVRMGMIVDAVDEVLSISAADIEETPDFGSKISADYILGLAKIRGAVIGLLNIERVVGSEALERATATV